MKMMKIIMKRIDPTSFETSYVMCDGVRVRFITRTSYRRDIR